MVFIQKANGEKEEFSEDKLRSSIKRAGIPQDLEEEVVSHVKGGLHEGIRTSEIYHHIVEFLGTSKEPLHRARYSLKQSIMDLGPTGYPFEKFIARLLDKAGYTTQTNVIAQGKCITHEIDVIATKGQETIMVEAKFHNGAGIKTDVQVSLYTQARFEDTKEKNHFTHPMLVTNTKATTDAIAYASCVGMEILTWSYPEGKGLRELVEEYHLHPITSLATLSNIQKQRLLEQNIVLCSELVEKAASVLLELPVDKKQRVIEEARFACSRMNHS